MELKLRTADSIETTRTVLIVPCGIEIDVSAAIIPAATTVLIVPCGIEISDQKRKTIVDFRLNRTMWN